MKTRLVILTGVTFTDLSPDIQKDVIFNMIFDHVNTKEKMEQLKKKDHKYQLSDGSNITYESAYLSGAFKKM